MRVFVRKKAATNVDWIVSLAIFIFFIGWFFILLNSVFSNVSPQGHFIGQQIVKDNQKEVESIPLFVYGNHSNKPVVFTDYDYEKLLNNKSVIIDNKMFSYVDSAGVFEARQIHSLSDSHNIIVNDSITTSNLRYENKVLYYKDKEIFFEHEFNNKTVGFRENNTLVEGFVVRRRFMDFGNRLDTYILEKTPYAYNFLAMENYGLITINLKFEGYNKILVGENIVDVDGCENYETGKLSFYDGDGVAIFFPESKVKICDNESITVELSNYDKQFEYTMKFHDSDYDEFESIKERKRMTTKAGIPHKIKALDIGIVTDNNQTYENKYETDFSYTLKLQNGSEIVYEPEAPPENRDVFVENKRCQYFSENNELKECRLRVKTW